MVAETDLAGTLKSEYVFFDGERVARRDGATGTGGVFYYFSDHLKTASVITDSAGVIKAESDYYPWGGEIQFVNNDSNHYKFTGKERDGETQLDYFGARHYSNGLGRWVSADWSSVPVPVPYADFGNPQSLNLYGFIGGNPASKADPDGHGPDLEGLIITWTIDTYGPRVLPAVQSLANDIGNAVSNFFDEAAHGFNAANSNCSCNPQSAQSSPEEDSKQNNNNSKSTNQSESGGQDKKSPNPNGSKGAPDHQQTAKEEAAKMGPDGQREVRVETPDGEKGSRVIDAAKVENGKVTEATQVIRPNKNGTPPAREVRAARDIQKATGVMPKMVPVRPKTQE